MKRQVRGGSLPLKNIDKPKCPNHRHEMFFNKQRLVWECPDPGCKMVAHPPNNVGGGKSVSLNGSPEVTVVTDRNNNNEETFLLHVNKVYLDITPYVGAVAESPGKYEITLLFDSVTKVDQDGMPL